MFCDLWNQSFDAQGKEKLKKTFSFQLLDYNVFPTGERIRVWHPDLGVPLTCHCSNDGSWSLDGLYLFKLHLWNSWTIRLLLKIHISCHQLILHEIDLHATHLSVPSSDKSETTAQSLFAAKPFFKVSVVFSGEEILLESLVMVLEWHSLHFCWEPQPPSLGTFGVFGKDAWSGFSPRSIAPVICVIQKLNRLTVYAKLLFHGLHVDLELLQSKRTSMEQEKLSFDKENVEERYMPTNSSAILQSISKSGPFLVPTSLKILF